MKAIPGSIIGYRKNGLPIRLQAGGSMPAEPLNDNSTGTLPPQPIVINNPPQGQYFTAEQLEAARQQEKDKLYGRLQTLEGQFNDSKTELDKYRQEREAAETARIAAEKLAADAERKAADEKLSVQQLIEKRDAEWQQQKAEMEQRLELERTLAQKDRELFQLQNYIQRRVSEEIANNTIIPDLAEYIDGSNEAAVEESINKAKEKTASIVAGAMGQSGGPRITPGVSPTGFAPTGPLDNLTGVQQYSVDDIKAMSSKEYADFRAKAGIANAGNNRGLFN